MEFVGLYCRLCECLLVRLDLYRVGVDSSLAGFFKSIIYKCFLSISCLGLVSLGGSMNWSLVWSRSLQIAIIYNIAKTRN